MDGFATIEPIRPSSAASSGTDSGGAKARDVGVGRLRFPVARLAQGLWCGVLWGLFSFGGGTAAVAQTPGRQLPFPPQLPAQLPMATAFATGSEPLIYTPHTMHPGLQFLPPETIYPAYLAGPTEPRLGTQYFSEADDGPLWDSTLGGRVGLFRWGGFNGMSRWQLDVEGAAILRLDPEENIDLRSADFRAGAPLTMAWGPHRFKFGYYHLSAHIGDEFLIKNPDFERLNYVRDALIFGYSRYATERLRLYGEASWAFYHEISEPWQFQIGMEYAPTRPTGILGEPFFAINGQLREEVDFGGTVTVHTGWAWREGRVGRLLRTGLFFQAGKSHQSEFYDESERQIGVGLWYDF